MLNICSKDCFFVQKYKSVSHTYKLFFTELKFLAVPYITVGTVILKYLLCEVNFVDMDEISKSEGKGGANLALFALQNGLTLGLTCIFNFIFFKQITTKINFFKNQLFTCMDANQAIHVFTQVPTRKCIKTKKKTVMAKVNLVKT